MKRKIKHDAVNNQEDEDSSTYPTNFIADEAIDKRKPIENSTIARCAFPFSTDIYQPEETRHTIRNS
jgi:hypothetical protein